MRGIYKITCSVNGKVYVGSSGQIALRWARHRESLNAGKHHSVTFQRAWNKYGADAFVFEVLEQTPEGMLLWEREAAWINALLPFYNTMRPCENDETRRKHGPETQAKMTAAQKAHWEKRRETGDVFHSEETKEKMRQKAVGRKASPEARAKMSAAAKRRPPPPPFNWTPEFIEKCLLARAKKPHPGHSPEAKENMRLAALKRGQREREARAAQKQESPQTNA